MKMRAQIAGTEVFKLAPSPAGFAVVLPGNLRRFTFPKAGGKFRQQAFAIPFTMQVVTFPKKDDALTGSHPDGWVRPGGGGQPRARQQGPGQQQKRQVIQV
jgi:hypothetical protein